MKCKVINGSKNNLEQLTNEWLATGKYEIVEIQQTQIESYITLTIFYLEIKEAREKKLKRLDAISKN
jgi:predicted amino acid-binding ACT domain protein